MSRTKNTIRNIKVAAIGQALGLLISFISRKIFVLMLPTEYLGLSGLFANILSLLSLTELGFGTAIVYSLYKPLAENDNEKIKALMQLFKRVYTLVGGIVLVAGSALTPFLDFFINDRPDIPENIYVIYLMYVFNSAASYFFTYKRSLIIANQQRYIATVYRYGLYIVLNVLQSVALIITRSFYLYLVLLIVNTIVENLLVSNKANRLFPCLKEKDIKPLARIDTDEIKKNVFAMMCHKIGGVLATSTSSLLISKFVGLFVAGIYSNYQLIISAINTVLGLSFQSITASFGNLSAKESSERKQEVFDTINFVTFWLAGFCVVMLIVLVEPFITIWLGETYLCGMTVVLTIVANFYLRTMRQPVLMTREAMGLFWYDRYKPLAEATVNLLISIVLGAKFGLVGVLLGTTASTLFVNMWVEPWVLYKYGFGESVCVYFKNLLIYTLEIFVVAVVTCGICALIPSMGVFNFALKALVASVLCNVLFLLLNLKNKQIMIIFEILKSVFVHKK